MKILRPFILFVIISGLIVSCTEDYFDLKKLSGGFWKPDVAVPLVDSYLSLNDILTLSDKNGNFQVGSDNFITLVYKDNLFSLMARDFIKIPDPEVPLTIPSLNIPQSALTAFNFLSPGDSITFPAVNSTIAFSIAPHSIQTMKLHAGIIAFSLNNSLPAKIRAIIKFPSITENGVQKMITGTIPSSQGSPVTSVIAADLGQTTVELNSAFSPGTSGIDYEIQLYLIKDQSSQNINGAASLDGTLTYTQLNFKSLYGTFDLTQQQLAPNTDTVAITLFNNVVGQADFDLVNPSLRFDLQNSFGIPFKGEFELLSGLNSKSNSNIPFTLPDSMRPFNINYPLFSQLGQSKLTSYTLSRQTSNVTSVLNTNPNYLIYKVKNLPTVNPPGNINFVEDTSRFKLDMEIIMPLDGRVNGLVFQDTLPFSLREADEIEELELRTFITNGFPLDVKMNIYFADDNNNILSKLYETDAEPIIAAAAIDATGKSTIGGFQETTTIVPASVISRLSNVTKIFIKAVTSTSGAAAGKNVKFYSDYRIDVKISGRAKLNFSLN